MKTNIYHHRYLNLDNPRVQYKIVLGEAFRSYSHRELYDIFGDKSVVDPLGGETIFQFVDDSGNVVAEGSADCSLNDNYNKKIGIHIARGRAQKMMGIRK